MIQPVRLQTEHLFEPVGIDQRAPRMTWNIEGADQAAFRIVFTGDQGTRFDSGLMQSREMHYKVPAEFKWRERVDYTLTVYSQSGEESAASSKFEIALGHDNFVGKWINPEAYAIDKKRRYPGSVLKKTFVASAFSKARLYATAKGIYAVLINGKRVPTVLAPGTFQSNRRQLYQTYDIAEFIREGENDIVFLLTDGWYRGSMENTGNTYRFGTELALLAQIELDHKAVAVTDRSWKATQSGPIRFSDLMQGETYDARMEDLAAIKDWHEAAELAGSYETLRCSNAPLLAEHERFKGKLLTTPAGEKVFDFGQNLAGYVEISFTSPGGQTLEMMFGEELDKHGNFTNANFQNPKKTVYQKLSYTSKQGKNTYKPYGTYMGFRYMKINGLEGITDFEVTAIAIYSDLEFTGEFHCSNSEVNQLFSNALWSLKGNFTDIPTDCPTREKDGFTGDYQAYIHTAMYLTNCYAFSRRWLEELAAAQFEDGCLPMVAPSGRKRELFDGTGGWSDALTIVAEKIGKRYGDYTAAEQLYTSMKRWADFSLKRARKKTRLRNRRNPHHQYLLDTGMHWGEWLEPGSNVVRDLMKIGIQGEPEVATAYLYVSCRIVSELAERFGHAKDAAYYKDAAEKAKKAYRHYAMKDGAIESPRMARYVRPLVFGLLTDQEAKQAAKRLNELVVQNNYCQNTGFLSTHELTRVLTDYGYTETAYKLLLHEECPGWIYPVRKGATTIWEQWDGIDEQGELHASLNHYSYGAVVGWLFDRVGGIRVENGSIKIQPYPSALLGEAQVSYLSPYGKISSSWKIEHDRVTYELEIPGNMTAEVVLGNERMVLQSGSHRFEQVLAQA